MPNHDIIVIGASAGGVDALQQLISFLPSDCSASIFIVLHVPQQSSNLLPGILQRKTRLPVQSPEDMANIEPGHVYVAAPNHHLLIEEDHVRSVRGPPENRHRPAIDPLFRSAAWAYGPRVVGVVLTGTLDDGAGGLWAVKTCGGVTIVQDPAEAAFPDMPANAMRVFQPDHCLPLKAIAVLLGQLSRQVVSGNGGPKPHHLKVEVDSAMGKSDMHDMPAIGPLSAFTCPTCHGALWEVEEGELLRYRCHVGHAFAGDSLVAEQTEMIEDALYSALRAIEEKIATVERLGERMGQRLPLVKDKYLAKARDLENQASVLRDLLAGKQIASRTTQLAE